MSSDRRPDEERLYWIWIVFILLMILGGYLGGQDKLTLQVSTRFDQDSKYVSARVRVKQAASDRRLVLAWESESGAGETSRQMDSDSPQFWEFRLPYQRGEWDVVVAVYDDRGKLAGRVSEHVEVF